MRQLILIRHIKSSWSDPSLKDFDRPIKKSRIADLEKVLSKVQDRIGIPDLILVSASKRTRQTFKVMEKTMGKKQLKAQVVFSEILYECSANDLATTLGNYRDSFEKIWVIGHNPGLTEFINRELNFILPNLPTSGLFVWEKNEAGEENCWNCFPKSLEY